MSKTAAEALKQGAGAGWVARLPVGEEMTKDQLMGLLLVAVEGNHGDADVLVDLPAAAGFTAKDLEGLLRAALRVAAAGEGGGEEGLVGCVVGPAAADRPVGTTGGLAAYTADGLRSSAAAAAAPATFLGDVGKGPACLGSHMLLWKRQKNSSLVTGINSVVLKLLHHPAAQELPYQAAFELLLSTAAATIRSNQRSRARYGINSEVWQALLNLPQVKSQITPDHVFELMRLGLTSQQSDLSKCFPPAVQQQLTEQQVLVLLQEGISSYSGSEGLAAMLAPVLQLPAAQKLTADQLHPLLMESLRFGGSFWLPPAWISGYGGWRAGSGSWGGLGGMDGRERNGSGSGGWGGLGSAGGWGLGIDGGDGSGSNGGIYGGSGGGSWGVGGSGSGGWGSFGAASDGRGWDLGIDGNRSNGGIGDGSGGGSWGLENDGSTGSGSNGGIGCGSGPGSWGVGGSSSTHDDNAGISNSSKGGAGPGGKEVGTKAGSNGSSSRQFSQQQLQCLAEALLSSSAGGLELLLKLPGAELLPGDLVKDLLIWELTKVNSCRETVSAEAEAAAAAASPFAAPRYKPGRTGRRVQWEKLVGCAAMQGLGLEPHVMAVLQYGCEVGLVPSCFWGLAGGKGMSVGQLEELLLLGLGVVGEDVPGVEDAREGAGGTSETAAVAAALAKPVAAGETEITGVIAAAAVTAAAANPAAAEAGPTDTIAAAAAAAETDAPSPTAAAETEPTDTVKAALAAWHQ